MLLKYTQGLVDHITSSHLENVWLSKKRMIEAARTNSEEAKGESCLEFEKFEEIYQVLEAQKEKDETATELYADVKDQQAGSGSEDFR